MALGFLSRRKSPTTLEDVSQRKPELASGSCAASAKVPGPVEDSWQHLEQFKQGTVHMHFLCKDFWVAMDEGGRQQPSAKDNTRVIIRVMS